MAAVAFGLSVFVTLPAFIVTRASAASADTPAVRGNQLLAAARQNDTATIRRLLQQRVDVNARQTDGATALLWAAYYNDTATVSLLLGAGADLTLANQYGETPLSLACENGNMVLVSTLLEAGADATARTGGGDTMLMLGARAGQVEVVRTLIAYGADVNASEPAQHQTPLMWAAAHRQTAIVDALLNAGAKVNAATTRGTTALHFAVTRGDTETARRLLAAGADVGARMTVRQIDGFTLGLVETLEAMTPLHLAIADCRQDGPEFDGAASAIVAHPVGELCPVSEELGMLMLEHGADANDPDGSRIPPLHQAVRARMNRLASALVARGADVNARVTANVRQMLGPARRGARTITPMPIGATPFFLAAWSHNPELMETFLKAGADPQVGIADHTTPLMAAAGVIGRPAGMRARTGGGPGDALDSVRLAIEHGGDVAAVNDAGQTAVHGAARMALDPVVEFLVERGARLDVVDKKGETPLSLAKAAEAKSTVALVTRLAGDRRVNATTPARPNQ